MRSLFDADGNTVIMPMERKKKRAASTFIRITFLGHESNKALSVRPFPFQVSTEGGSVFLPDGANIRSRSVTDAVRCGFLVFTDVPIAIKRSGGERKEGRNDAKEEEEERTELSIPPSIDHIQRGCQCSERGTEERRQGGKKRKRMMVWIGARRRYGRR